jgi:hypothetical protein
MPPGSRLLATATMLWPLVTWSASCPSNLRGDATDWAIAICYAQVETDDPAHPEVSACLGKLIARDHITKSNANSCTLKRKYRSVWCKQMVRVSVEKSVEICMRSSSMPAQVENPPS